MDIHVNSVNFGCKANFLQLNRKSGLAKWISSKFVSEDTFVRTTFDVNRDLKKVRLKEKINEGRHAEVYSTNYEGYVVRLVQGNKFIPKNLKAFDDPNGLIVAKDTNCPATQLMKYVKGEPLYGKGWFFRGITSKKAYMKEFERIQALPDETFAQYIRDIINIRKNGYNIDDVNPNNFLLDGEHIGIVDLEEVKGIEPRIIIYDFDPLINKSHLLKIFKTMKPKELYSFADRIKSFYDRMMRIAQEEGYYFSVSKVNDGGLAWEEHLVNYLYYKNWAMVKKLIKHK